MENKTSGGSPQTPLDKCLLCLLWFMSSLDKYASIADIFGLAESNLRCAIRNLLDFIKENLTKKIILWPTAEEQREIQDMYKELHNFPGVIHVGMIDESHIQIRWPYSNKMARR